MNILNYSNEEKELIGKALLLEFIMDSFNPQSDDKLYILCKKFLKENEEDYKPGKGFDLLTLCLPYLFDREDWLGNKEFAKNDLIEIKNEIRHRLFNELYEEYEKAEDK